MIPPLLTIFAWPLVALVFFWTMRLPLAVIVTVLAGYLLLPENTVFDLPLLPSLNKHTVPVLTALALAAAFGWSGRLAGDGPVARRSLLPAHWLARLLLPVLVVSAFMTVMTNADPVVFPTQTLPGLRPYDAFSIVLSAIMMILPLLLARKYLADPAAQRLLLVALCIAALGYSLLMLVELRMSPQINLWVYGFFPHSWEQHVRGGGFRPVVFLSHGLMLGVFLAMAVLATVGLARLFGQRRGQILFAAVWLLAVLLVSKNLGAALIALAFLPFALLFGVLGQLLVAAVVAGMFLSYPVMRNAHVLPLEQILNFAEHIDPQRASSFQTRLENEERMLAKAAERPLFGWGGWGRWRVHDEEGNDITIADGYWVAVIGADGWLGYIARLGLLTGPIFLLLLRNRMYAVGLESSIIALLLAANLVDMVPNSSVTPLTGILAGSLWGRLELGRVGVSRPGAVSVAAGRLGYRRSAAADPPDEMAAPPPEDASAEVPLSAYTRQSRRIERRRTSSTEAS